jgi:sugar-specific transcriptional regulator TrmB
MVVEEKTLNRLRQIFKLNLYEVKLWLALLGRGQSTAGELSDMAAVPRSRAYDILESLERKGFVMVKLGKPIKYMAVPPEQVIERVKQRIKTRSEEFVDTLDKLKETDIMDKLKNLFEHGMELIDPTELSAAVKGRHNLHDHLETMLKDAKEEVVIYANPAEMERLAVYHLPSLKELKKRGVKIRIITTVTEKSAENIKTIMEVAEIRHSDDVHAKFYLIDSNEIMFHMIPEEQIHPTYDTAIWVQAPLFATALSDLFEHAWEKFEHASKMLPQVIKAKQ